MGMHKFAKAMALAFIGVVAPLSGAAAHHSFAMYDNSREVVLDGVVKHFKWSNPHGQIMLTVSERGKPVDYEVELSSPNVMSRQGWTKATIKPGERMKVKIHPMRDGSKAGSFKGATKADGTVLGQTAPR